MNDVARAQAVAAKLAGPAIVWRLVWKDLEDFETRGGMLFWRRDRAIEVFMSIAVENAGYSDIAEFEHHADDALHIALADAIKEIKEKNATEFGNFDYELIECQVNE